MRVSMARSVSGAGARSRGTRLAVDLRRPVVDARALPKSRTVFKPAESTLSITLEQAIQAVAAAPADLRHRAELANALERAGAQEEADAVWQATARAAAGRGEFFVSLALGRRYLSAERLEALLADLAVRFGAGRPRQGPLMAPPAAPAQTVTVPADPDEQVFIALRQGTKIDDIVLPKFARMPAIPIFEELPAEDFVALAREVEPVLLHDGLELLSQDTVERKVFLLVQGQAKTTVRTVDGKSVDIGVRRGPTLLGEMSLLTEVPRKTSLTALGPGIAWRMDAERIVELGLQRPALIERVRTLVKQHLLTDLLEHSRVLAAVPNKDAIVQAFTVRPYAKGATVIEQNAPPPGLFFVLHGDCEVWVTDADGNAAEIAELHEGDAFGEMSLLTGQPTTASVVMPDGGILLHLPAADWHKLSGAAPTLGEALTALADVRRTEIEAFVADGSVDIEEVEDTSWAIEGLAGTNKKD
jgi:CRP-like cAMP-binding protein